MASPDTNEIRDGFVNEIAALGRSAHSLDFGKPGESESPIPREERVAWLAEQIRALPLPLAVMAADDRYAAEVALAAQKLGLRIPQDIAVLGAEDQILHRKVVSAELSSIDVNFREVARRGCEILERLLQGAKPGSKDVPMLTKVPPNDVIVQQSTVTFNCDHPGVTAAAIFIRQHYTESISVTDIANHVGMSVRALQADYPSRVGCTIKEDILNARFKRAQYLLERTELKLSAVATESEFGNAEYLCRMFQIKHHTTPHVWRQQHRPA